MEIETNNTQDERLLGLLEESRAFKKNKGHYLLFYAASVSSVIMFIIILVLLSYSVSIGEEVHALTTKAGEILDNVAAMLPIVKRMCQHTNFTKSYGNICQL